MISGSMVWFSSNPLRQRYVFNTKEEATSWMDDIEKRINSL